MENKAILVGVNLNKQEHDFQYSMEELENLAIACNIKSVGSVTQNLNRINQAHYIGSGKIEELQEMVEETGADTIIFDDELSPSQIRNLESVIPDCEVVDRTTLILEIFAKRAKTRESKLQVEIAQLRYRLPRLIGSRESLGRQGGGSGLNNRGAGETKLEMDRRKIEEQIAKLSRELEHLVGQRKMQRRKREKNEISVVSLVGYTNAGKSTMMNAVLESYNGEKDKHVFEKNMLFATLETSVRSVTLATNQSFLLTDTVGFINKLPHHLVKAFRSTLEEVAEADLLIHVIDVSNPHHQEQRQLTNEILGEIGIEGIPVIHVYNKVDLLEEEYPLVDGDKVYVSAKNRQGMDALMEQIKQHIFNDYARCELLIPYNEGQVVSYFNEHANVLEEDFASEGTKLIVECKKADAEKFRKYITHIYRKEEE
ncbi:GTPase HflX [Oceanobacillus chungangensis]|uniref:GTPase HflX n=1 Tax=Oceanobacillus chungangensis TaxID=1229152 RepID=A0A3D8PM02_9BACI|nr:GTPase HflX [Oceanobacillus chungangensis]RDW16261.1 GTPase HflX [Oceanobacillus chungangensis]